MSSTAENRSRKRLESWKAVATHFGRDVTTVRRWERREGLPIHRLHHDKLGSIYAFTDELDAWWDARTARAPAANDPATILRAASPDAEPVSSSAPARPDAAGSFSGLSKRLAAVGTILAASALVVAVAGPPDVLTAWREAPGHGAAPPASATATGVAVLPLVNTGSDGGEPHFGDGMTTALTAELAAVKPLKVVATTSSKRYRARRGLPLSAIARELEVDWIVDGSVQRFGSHVRITVGLTRARGERMVWSQSFERPIEQVLDLQAAVARELLVQMLGPAHAGAPRATPRRISVDVHAYESYLRGEFDTEQLNPVSLARAVEYFTQAVTQDPGFAPAWAGLAKANLLQEFWGGAAPGSRATEVRRAIFKALALDPHLAEAHDVMGRVFLIYDRDWPAAESAFRKAIAEAPSLSVAYNGYSILLQTLLRFDEAFAAAAKARELDPMTPWSWTEEGRAYYRARRYDEAEARYRRALAIEPTFVPALDRVVQLYLAQGREPEARRALGELERLPTARNLAGLRARLAAITGDAAIARRAAAELRHPYPVLIALGDFDAAFADLERALADGSLAGFVLGNPELDPVRSDPRFARLVGRLGLPVDRLVTLGRGRPGR